MERRRQVNETSSFYQKRWRHRSEAKVYISNFHDAVVEYCEVFAKQMKLS